MDSGLGVPAVVIMLPAWYRYPVETEDLEVQPAPCRDPSPSDMVLRKDWWESNLGLCWNAGLVMMLPASEALQDPPSPPLA